MRWEIRLVAALQLWFCKAEMNIHFLIGAKGRAFFHLGLLAIAEGSYSFILYFILPEVKV